MSSFLRPTSVLVLILTTSLVACGGASEPVAEGPSGLDAPDRMLSWTAEPVYQVGGFDAPDWATFGDVSRVAFDEAGNLYIMDDQTSTVTVVDLTGEPARTVGGAGEGPGELQAPFGVAVLKDGRVAVSDFGPRAVVLYGPDGEWEGNARLDLGVEGLPGSDMQPLPSGRLLSAQGMRIQMQGEGNVSISTMGDPDTRPLWTYPTMEGDTAAMIYGAWNPPPPPEGGEASLSGGDGDERMQITMSRQRAFSPPLLITALPDGRVAVVDSVAYTVKLVQPGEGLVGSLERPIPPTEVTPRIEEMERDRQLAEIEESGGGGLRIIGGGGIDIDQDAMKRMLMERLESMVFYPVIPVVEALSADWDGRIWVQRSSGTPGEEGPTDLITPDGQYLGSLPADGLRIPDAFGPDGLAAYIDLDQYDVATIRVVRLPRDGG